MSHLISLFNGILSKSTKEQIDDDLIDRMYHRFTTGILVVFAIVVSTSQYAGDPIECWAPPHYTSNHVKYANSFCWSYGTYYLPFDEHVENRGDKSTQLHYYQWVPFLLLLQAVFAYLPVFFWKYAINKSSVNVQRLISSAKLTAFSDEKDERKKSLNTVCSMLQRYESSRKNRSSQKNIFSTKRSYFLFACYLTYKVTCLSSIILQLIALNLFLRNDFYSYGIDFARYVFGTSNWVQSYRFPRVTMCDIEIRRLGNVNTYTLQCVLPINIFNEKIYLFIWFWLLIIAMANIASTIAWIYSTIVTLKKITVNYSLNCHITDNVDSVFLIRLVKKNTNAITGDEILRKLYSKNYTDENSSIGEDEKDSCFLRVESSDDKVDESNQEYDATIGKREDSRLKRVRGSDSIVITKL